MSKIELCYYYIVICVFFFVKCSIVFKKFRMNLLLKKYDTDTTVPLTTLILYPNFISTNTTNLILCILILSDTHIIRIVLIVQGVYSANPNPNPNLEIFDRIDF